MNPIAPMHEPAIRDMPLCRLALAPENVCKTPPDEAAQAQLEASIAEHDLLENLVVRPDESDADDIERFAVVAGRRRLEALEALAENGTLHADHPVPCNIIANDRAQGLSLAENVVRIAMHPADPVVAFAGLAASGLSVATIAARFVDSGRTVEQRLRLCTVGWRWARTAARKRARSSAVKYFRPRAPTRVVLAPGGIGEGLRGGVFQNVTLPCGNDPPGRFARRSQGRSRRRLRLGAAPSVNRMTRILSVVQSMTDKIVELSRAVVARLSYGESKRRVGVGQLDLAVTASPKPTGRGSKKASAMRCSPDDELVST